MDLKSKSAKELEKLLSDVKKALADAQARERREAIKAAEKAAAEYGFSLSELTDGKNAVGKTKKAGRAKTVAAPKYANPADASQTWTGKGRQPNWYRAEIEQGTSAESMEI
ncbi:H-NS histone family protein [Sulfitobacter sp. THAF37]|uniref:H-NS histone family protein n=1 Tax=Sulfitobacter sp. THAF37 TaxID=2587855 RepID=UPI0012A9F063|nr:H-NS histone family protein [Sulfitobacter sp. THAF37]QFT58995.1 H-NS histone family protein [Sulfitobacter sp. THAF37]